jgi:hypothetical protein
MDEKVEAMGKTITVNESKSTLIKWIFISTTAVFLVTTVVFIALYANEKGKDKEVEYKDLYNNIHITNEWDKVFEKSDQVNHKKVTFHNRFGITLVGDLYEPKNKATGKLPAIAVCGPFGAVKEQSSGLYAMKMAERGFITLAFDPSFTGESGGLPRDLNSPDINTDDFSAAVDYLSVQDDIDSDKISIIGICGFGGFALNVAAIDPRIKVTIVSTMYDMSRVIAYGYNDATTADKRYATRVSLAEQRISDYKNGYYAFAGGNPDERPAEAGFLQRYWDYYKTERGYHKRSLNSNKGWITTAASSLLNTKLLQFTNEIRNAVLIIHGENAHSYYMGNQAYQNMITGSYNSNKEFYRIPGADHTDLYDNLDVIPFEKIQTFINNNL